MDKKQPNDTEPGRHISQIETIWPVLRQAHDGDPAAVSAAQQVILKRYRPAIYRYLVACLGDTEAADDLCQEFSLRFVRGDFRNANPERGRFRDLLKSSLYHLIIDYHKRRQRRMPQLAPGAPEPAADTPSTHDSDRQFLAAWRADLLNKAWEKLAQEEQKSGQPMHTVLHFRASHPEMRSATMAEQLTEKLVKKVSADWVRKWLHEARERFAALLLDEVTASLDGATEEAIIQELIDLELYQYCKVAIDRRLPKETDED
jgi:RNA polymerase sigma-70 factor (ECF subfamily)